MSKTRKLTRHEALGLMLEFMSAEELLEELINSLSNDVALEALEYVRRVNGVDLDDLTEATYIEEM